MLSLILKKTSAAKIADGYPWIFRQDCSLTSELELAEPGSLVQVCDARAKPLAVGYFHPGTQLVCRILAHQPHAVIDDRFFHHRFSEALKKREGWFDVPYYRLIHSEGDYLPGLVVDRFADVLVCQVTTAGMEKLKSLWQPALTSLTGAKAIVFRNDVPIRAREGLALDVQIEGTLPAMPIDVLEHGTVYLADLLTGQKTGWFYDQRENRRHIAEISAGKIVADFYSHSGGFGIAAARAGAASVTMIDGSELALTLSKQAAQKNQVGNRCAWVQGDVFELLQAWQKEEKTFDIVVADPPAFIKSKEHLHSGLKGYEKLARLCTPLVNEGGKLFIASCSHHATPSAFRQAVEKGMRAADRKFQLVRSAGADSDHPVHPLLKENAYLKALTYALDGEPTTKN